MLPLRFVSLAGVTAAGVLLAPATVSADREAARRSSLRAEVAFEPGSTALSDDAAQVLDDLAVALSQRDDEWVVVVAPSLLAADEGVRDDPKAVVDQKRQALEGKRQEVVSAFLVAQGVPRARIVGLERAADLDPGVERVMLYLEDSTVTESSGPAVAESEAAETKDDQELSFYPVLPAERREVPDDESEREQTRWTPPYYGAGEYVDPEQLGPPLPEAGNFLGRVGLGLSVGAGLSGFVDGDTRAFAGAGGAWDARVTLGTRMPVAIEASYFGSANQIEALGLDDGAVLLGQGVEGDLRIELLPSLPVRPYVFGGFGWSYFQITNASTNTSSVRDDDAVLHAPVGAGVTFQHGRMLFDLRGLVRPTFDDDMLAEASEDRARLSTWGALAKLGWEL